MVALTGASGLRQVDAHEHPRLPRSPDFGRLLARRRGSVAALERRSGPCSAIARSASCSRTSTCSAHDALDNMAMPLMHAGTVSESEASKRAAALLERVGLGDRLDHHPTQLSGGQQQRVALARALINSPPLLFADEPTGNLDSRTSQEILQMLHDFNRTDGVTVVLVTHEPDIARYAQRVIHPRHGVIAANTEAGVVRDVDVTV